MKIPRLFYGPPGQATSRVRTLASVLVKTGSFATHDVEPFVDTAEVPGLILLSEGWGDLPGLNFHCYALSEELEEASGRQRGEVLVRWLESSLESEWQFVCTLAGAAPRGLRAGGPSLARRYLDAAIKYWPLIERELHRFGPLLPGATVFQHWHTLSGAAAQLGIPPISLLEFQDRRPQAILDAVENARRGE